MHLLIVLSLVSFAFAAPQGYNAPPPPSPSYSSPAAAPVGCSNGQVLGADGNCVQPIVTRNVFLYAAPQVQAKYGPAPVLPQPKVDYNIVFVRTPEAPAGQEPIVVPPPQQKTIVYVLTQNGEVKGQQVIEVPYSPQSPEVYYVNYNDGDNPQLQGGLDLQGALASAAQQQAQVIQGGGAGGGAGVGGGYGGNGGGFAPSQSYRAP